ncbi:Med5-domain-containing protein, partial [Metschnikowia bicuspidata var. bicuspidata NRRL YB-4993]
MSSTTLLKKLLRASLARNTNPKLFASLLEQLLAREQISDAELGEMLLNVADSPVKANSTTSILARRLQIEYVLEFAFSSSENLARFFKLLPQLSLKSQLKYILYFKTQVGKIIDRSLINEFYNGLAQFTIAASPSRPGECSPHSNRLWYHVVFVWGAFIDLDSSIPANPSLKESFQKMALFAGDLEDDYIGALISRKFGAAADPGASLNFQTTRMAKSEEAPTTMPEKSLSLNLNGKKYSNYVSLKKFIWLNFHFQLWKMDTEMSRAFMTFFNLQDLSHTDLAKELICSFLNGAAVAVRLGEEPYVIFNWKNFILTHLAQDLKEIVLSSHAVDHEWHETVSAAITSCNDLVITETKIGGVKESYNLNKEFMRSCLHQELISLEKYIQVFPSEAENLSTSILAHEIENLRLTELITAEFKSRLENVNPEFTSLQESNLIDYFKNLPLTNFRFLNAKQCKLAQLSENLIDNIVREKNNEKLRWISLVFLNVPSIANFIFYQSRKGPWMFLSKIINYIDSESFNVDEDDGNFQDTYACFGVILTSVISVAAFFGIEFASLGLKNSYTIDYINQFYFRLCNMLTNTYTGASEQEKQIISNYENLVTEWANALFDVNNDGLSDDLLKSVNVKQIYK